jgi:heme-degrading monooxygenase HmoA
MWQRLVREGDWIPFGRGHDQADDQREDEGPAHEAYTLYSSHTVWQSKATFEAWTKSEAFRLAHRDAGQNKPLYLDHPQFEGFEVRQTVRRGEDAVA